MTNIFDVLYGLENQARKEISISDLPTRGLFYPPDLALYILPMTMADIVAIRETDMTNYIKSDYKKLVSGIVRAYTTYSNNYTLDDICYYDCMFIFWEIIKHTKKGGIIIDYYDTNNESQFVYFDHTTFNYFDFSPYMDNYDPNERCFIFDGYLYSLPKIGIEESIIKYIEKETYRLLAENNKDELHVLQNSNCYFMYFCSKYKRLTHDQVENLMIIYNHDLEDEKLEYINKIINKFRDISSYTLKDKENIIQLNLEAMVEHLFKYGL